MSDGRHSWRLPGRRLLSVAAITAVVMVGVLARLWIVALGASLVGDGQERYDPLARSLLAGHGFSRGAGPECLHVPGYPAVLAGAYLAAGGPTRGLIALQMILELATVSLIWAGAKTAYGKQIARVAVGVAWLSIELSVFTRQALPALLAAFGTTLLCVLLVRAHAEPHWAMLSWAAAGLTSGLLALVRVDHYPLALAAPLVVAASASTPLARRVRGIGVYLLAAIIPIGAWGVRQAVVCGSIGLPGWEQYTPVRAPFVSWLDTWLDDPRLIDAYGYRVLDAGAPTAFPVEAPLSLEERSRASAALARAKELQTLSDPYVADTFTQLAATARAERGLVTRSWIRVKRVALTWAWVPGLLPRGPRSVTKAAVYASWWAVLCGGVVGTVLVVARRNTYGILLSLVVLSRSAMPFVSAWGAVPYYLAPAFSAMFVLAPVGWAWLIVQSGRARRLRDARRGRRPRSTQC